MRFVTIEILYLTLLLKNEMASFNLNIKSKVSFICRQLIQQIALRSDKESHLSALKLLSVDVAIVFANLIDNTIESCIQMPAAERWVSVQILHSHEILSISIIYKPEPPDSNHLGVDRYNQTQSSAARIWPAQCGGYSRKVPR